jgi:hypothetical protein
MNTKNVINAIAKLDLEPIKTKLMHVASGEGWSRAKVDALDVEYRRFLYLMHAYPNEAVAPTAAVDTFWHYHILDTMKYAADCEATFGYFVHHYPYMGLETDAEAGDEQRGGQRMRELYEQTFGEAYIRAEAYGADQPQAAFCMMRPGEQIEAAAQSAFCMMPPSEPVQAGAQAAFCMMRPGEKQVEGAQAAFCMMPPSEPVQAGAQAAFCMMRPGEKKVEGAQAAFCMMRPGEKRAEGALAAFCMMRPGEEKKVQGAQAAFCMMRPGEQQSPVRPAHCDSAETPSFMLPQGSVLGPVIPAQGAAPTA